MQAGTFRGLKGMSTGNRLGLTDEQLVRAAPAIFADEAHASRSDKYTFIPTKDVFAGMRAEGFLPTQVVQARTRDDSRRGFTKHLVRFRRADQIDSETAREVILINSHDGGSAFKLMAGAFRFVCGNGLVFGQKDAEISVPHKGDVLGNVIEGAYSIVNEFDRVDESIDGMRSIALSAPQQVAFARAALQLRFDGDAPVEADRILRPRRVADLRDTSVWGTFNVVQENLVRGGLRGQSIDGNGRRKNVTTREVKGIDGNVALNRALWTLAEEMKKLAT